MRYVTIVCAPSMLLITFGVLSCAKTSDSTLWERANRIHEEAVVIDAHAHPKPGAAETLSLGEKKAGFEVDFVTMKEGGLDAVFFSLPVLTSESDARPDSVRILEDARAVADEVERFEGLAEIARSSEDISRIQALGKRAVLLGVESGDPFGGDIGTLERFFDAGIRMVTLSPEALAAPIPGQGDQNDSGLDGFGERVVEEMNRLGVIIDITHTPDSLQLDIIGTSITPVVASHSCTRALNDVPRQMPDSIIRALAERGGVICVTFYPGHISGGYPDQAVTVEDLVDHIDHIVQIAGVDHVGFGSDFLGSENHTVGLESAAGLPAITYSLLQRGYSKEEIEKILGGNLLRVHGAVQESAR
jgi:membrane dipeptidase